MGGSSDSSSYSISPSSDSSTSDDSWWSSSSSPSSPSEEAGGKEATHESIGTASAELSPAAKQRHGMVFWGGIALASAGAAALVMAALNHAPPRTTVIKLQVALRGVAAAKSFQKDLNEIAEKRPYVHCAVTRIPASLQACQLMCKTIGRSISTRFPLNRGANSTRKRSATWMGSKRKKTYSRKTDSSKNEYIVLTILIAAEGALTFPGVRNSADLEAVVGKLNSIPAGEIRAVFMSYGLLSKRTTCFQKRSIRT